MPRTPWYLNISLGHENMELYPIVIIGAGCNLQSCQLRSLPRALVRSNMQQAWSVLATRYGRQDRVYQ